MIIEVTFVDGQVMTFGLKDDVLCIEFMQEV